MTVRNYSDANTVLTGRNSQSRKLENNTYLERRGDLIAVRLHATDIVIYHPNGDTVLQTGGWKTPTTKDRMNEYSPVWISADKGVWYVGNRNSYYSVNAVPFADGFTIHADGSFSGLGEDPKANLKLKRKAAAYVKGYMEAFLAGKVKAPSAGDCWYCSLRPAKVETVSFGSNGIGKSASQFTNDANRPSMGEAFRDSSHIVSHIEEKYYVPSLLANAIKRFPVSQAGMWLIGSQWDNVASEDQKQSAYQAGLTCANQIQRSLRRYINDQLGSQAL